MITALRLLLALAYPFLAHAASHHNNGWLAALAMADMLLFMLIEPLWRLRPGAWVALACSLVGLLWLATSPFALLPLLLVPVVFIAMIAWAFARTLHHGRIPLITRLVAALDATAANALAPDLRDYTRAVTRTWALALGALAVINLILALIAQPRGLLASVGLHAPWSVTDTQWSWFANWFNYGIVAGVFVVEYLYRKVRFPTRYSGALHFAKRLIALGPAFWRDFFA